MRLGWLACAAFFLGCGSSSGSTLFGGSSTCEQSSSVSCVGANGCPGRAACGPNGEVGACICSAQPGAGGFAAGGVTGQGGIIAGSGGLSTGGFAGFTNTGGFPFSSGGVAGLPDGSIGSGGGAANVCPVGHFSGTYEGMYGGGILGMNPVNGTIEFSVDSNGSVTGTYTGTNPNNNSKADLVGTLDCSTFELTMNVENGTYQLLGMVRFSGTMPGKYSPETHAFSGTWQLSDTNSQSGTGTWTAQ